MSVFSLTDFTFFSLFFFFLSHTQRPSLPQDSPLSFMVQYCKKKKKLYSKCHKKIQCQNQLLLLSVAHEFCCLGSFDNFVSQLGGSTFTGCTSSLLCVEDVNASSDGQLIFSGDCKKSFAIEQQTLQSSLYPHDRLILWASFWRTVLDTFKFSICQVRMERNLNHITQFTVWSLQRSLKRERASQRLSTTRLKMCFPFSL